MKQMPEDGGLRAVSRKFLTTAILLIASATLIGAIGSVTGNAFLRELHPYIFFIGFGNLTILLLNHYLISAIYPKLKVEPAKEVHLIGVVLVAIALVALALALHQPLLKSVAGLLLLYFVSEGIIGIFRSLSLSELWKELSVRYYLFDILFLFVGNVGLFTLGLKEAFPDWEVIPFFVTRSSYFLGSSFPLSISVMGFLYSYAWSRSSKRELATRLFSIWFYTFIGGVLCFLLLILLGQYLGMMLVSHLLLFGVIGLLHSFARFLNTFFHKNFPHPALAFLLGGLSLLFVTSGFGIMNIFFLKGVPFGTVPPLSIDRMWIYHSHTHAALLGWITFSFTGIAYIVVPAIMQTGSLELLRSDKALGELLDRVVRRRAFVQLTVMLLSSLVLLVAFYLQQMAVLAVAGTVYAVALVYLLLNLRVVLYGNR